MFDMWVGIGGQWLLAGSAGFTLAVLMVIALRPLLRKLNVAMAYRNWLLLPMTLLLVAMMPKLPPSAFVSSSSDIRVVGKAIYAGITSALPQQNTVTTVVLSIWLFGALGCALAVMFQHRRYVAGLTKDHIHNCLRAPDERSPALIGVWRPNLVLPRDFEQRFDAHEQTLIRAHEVVHQRRQDNVWNALASSLLCLQWFNPVAHIALRMMRCDQELSCDAVVLRSRPESLATYAHALLKTQSVNMPSMFVCQWHFPHPLVERISMLQNHTPTPSATRAGRAVLLASALLAASIVYATQAPRIGADAPLHKLAIQVELEGTDGTTSNVVTHTSSPTVVVVDGQVARLRMNGARDATGTSIAWDIELKPHALRDNKLDLSAVISYGSPSQVIARPRMITLQGEKARVELTTVDGAHRLRLEVLATRVSKSDLDLWNSSSHK